MSSFNMSHTTEQFCYRLFMQITSSITCLVKLQSSMTGRSQGQHNVAQSMVLSMLPTSQLMRTLQTM